MSRRGSRKLAPMDPVLTGCVLALLGFSVLMVYSASLGVAEVRYNDSLRIIRHWLFYIPAGLLIMWGVSLVEATWWRALALPLLLIALALMVAVLAPGIGREINGAQRWFSMFGMTLQPVELLKPTMVIYTAYYLSAFPDRLQRFSSGLGPMLFMLAIAMLLLLLQPDFGSAALMAAVCAAMWFVGGIPIRHLAALILTIAPLAALALILEPYRLQRLTSFLDPWSDPYGAGYQLLQSMIAFGSGGLFGTGIGQGVQKLFYLPEVFTDFIAASIGEELGLAGTLTVILVFAILLARGIWLAIITEEMFLRLLTLGCMLLIGISFIINLGAAMGILPTKGMPMPFISYGGSALIGECILMGLVLSVQRHQPLNSRRQVRTPRKSNARKGKAKKAGKQAMEPFSEADMAPNMEAGLEHLF